MLTILLPNNLTTCCLSLVVECRSCYCCCSWCCCCLLTCRRCSCCCCQANKQPFVGPKSKLHPCRQSHWLMPMLSPVLAKIPQIRKAEKQLENRKLNYHKIVTAGAAATWLKSSRVESFENRVTFHKFAWFNNMTASCVNLQTVSVCWWGWIGKNPNWIAIERDRKRRRGSEMEEANSFGNWIELPESIRCCTSLRQPSQLPIAATNDPLLYEVLSIAYQWRRFRFYPLICSAIKMLIEIAARLSSRAAAAPENQTSCW